MSFVTSDFIMDWRQAYTVLEQCLTWKEGPFVGSQGIVEAEVTKILLYCGYDPTQQDGLLLEACLSSCVESVRLLLEDGRCNPNKQRIPNQVVSLVSIELLEAILEDARIDPTEWQESLYTSIIRADPDTLQRLLQDPRCDIHRVASRYHLIREVIYHCHTIHNLDNIFRTVTLIVNSGVKVENEDLIFSQKRDRFGLVSDFLALQLILQEKLD